MLNKVLKQFELQPVSISEVEDSHSSTVYKCELDNSETVFIKIPFSKLKYQREIESYKLLKGRVSIPKLLAYWSGDQECPGAFLLSELKGLPLTTNVSSEVAFQVGVLHASMHSIQPTNEIKWTGIENEFINWSSFIETQFYCFAEDVKEVISDRLYRKSIEKWNNKIKYR